MNVRRCSLWLLALLPACSSVEVPVESFYRLSISTADDPDPMRAGTLRVHDLQLGTSLDSDRLLLEDGLRLTPRPLARWVAPLDRLITDALVLGLSRARVCELVKGSADAGTESWSLHGRIVDFVEARPGDVARVTIELWLQQRGRLVFHEEFAVVEPLAGDGAEAAVAALSAGLNHVVADVVARMRALDLFAIEYDRQRATDVAEPPR